jgi:hypothetical protein
LVNPPNLFRDQFLCAIVLYDRFMVDALVLCRRPGVTTAHMLEQMIIGYQRALSGPRAQNLIESEKPESIKIVMRSAMSRT